MPRRREYRSCNIFAFTQLHGSAPRSVFSPRKSQFFGLSNTRMYAGTNQIIPKKGISEWTKKIKRRRVMPSRGRIAPTSATHYLVRYKLSGETS